MSLPEVSFQALSHREVSCYGISAKEESNLELDDDKSITSARGGGEEDSTLLLVLGLEFVSFLAPSEGVGYR